MQILHLIFICFIARIGITTAIEDGWQEGYFKISNDARVKDNDSKDKDIKLTLDEDDSIENFKIGNFLYSGENSLSLQAFDFLLFTLDRSDDKETWILKLKGIADFETKQSYRFKVTQGNIVLNVDINVINLNDCPLQLSGTSCTQKENIAGLTSCKYLVADEDGIAQDIQFSYSIERFKMEADNFIGKTQAEFTLYFKEEEDFETENTILLKWTAFDSVFSEVLTIIIKITDEPDQAPTWKNQIGSLTIPEEELYTFTVIATDGDIGVGSAVTYTINCADNCEKISVDPKSGVVKIDNIDRDPKDLSRIPFDVVATEVDAPNMVSEPQQIILLIQDKNDIRPNIDIQPKKLAIEENYNSHLEITIDMDDRDVGENATYDVSLSSTLKKPVINDFLQITPNRGFRDTSFSISVTNNAMLDFDSYEELRSPFKITITADDKGGPVTETIEIKLININDEKPEFKNQAGYTAEIPETFGRLVVGILEVENGKDFYAEDKDITDFVTYEIVGGSANRILELTSVKPGNGQPLVIKSRKQSNDKIQLFDYESQEEVLVSIKATDNFPLSMKRNSDIAQLTIKLIDVNDESPKLTADKQATSIMENIETPDAVDIILEANDADKTASLIFSINWDDSYAMKNGGKLTEEEFEDFKYCFTIDEIKEEMPSNQRIKAKLILDINKSPDYEVFDTLYLQVSVNDDNQHKDFGESHASLTIIINIENDNDNPPEFDESTFDEKSIKEHSDINTLIGIVKANDIDFLQDIQYTLETADGKDSELVKINDKGELYVKEDIEADPDILNIMLYVFANDGKHYVKHALTIKILDTNEHKPEFIPKSVYEVYENTENYNWDVIDVTDGDRDPAFTNFKCFLSGEGVPKYFQVTTIPNKGCEMNVTVIAPDVLNREDEPSYRVKLAVRDNPDDLDPTKQNVVQSEDITIKLLDENDNDPIVLSGQKFTVSEGATKGTRINVIKAEDLDEGRNGEFTFELLEVLKDIPEEFRTNDGEEKLGPEHFTLNPDSGELSLNTYLENLHAHGDYKLIIKTVDKGDVPREKVDNEVQLHIEKFNFKSVEFKPYKNSIILAKNQKLNTPLNTFDDVRLPHIEATDQQGEKYSIKFEITSTTPTDIFTLQKIDDRTTSLQLKKDPDYSVPEYNMIIEANSEDSSPSLPSATKSIKVRFLDSDADPTYSTHEFRIEFDEEFTGKLTDDFPAATYIEEIGIDVPIYYKIYESDPVDAFEIVDVQKTDVKVVGKLVLPNTPYFVVQASRSEAFLTPEAASLLKVIITLKDINNNAPKFTKTSEIGSLLIGTEGGTILTVKATDDDPSEEFGTVTYSIDEASYQTFGNELPGLASKPFNMMPTDGNLKLQFKVLASMTGRIEFDITADDGTHVARLPTKLSVISDVHLSSILFQNPQPIVQAKEKEVQQILEEYFELIVGIRSIQSASTSVTYEEVESTEVIAYFINETENIGVEKEVIQNRLNNFGFYAKLQAAFVENSLLLLNIVADPVEESLEETYKIALIVVAVISGVLLITLIGFFTYKIRGQSKRLHRLDKAEARRPTAVQMHNLPTANRRATAYNPKFNLDQTEDSVVDDLSFTSSPRASKKQFMEDDDEDFVGVENNDIFKIDNGKV